MKLWCATTNAGKLREFRLAHPNIEALPVMREIQPCPEDGPTFEVNAAQKAVYYSEHWGEMLFADDSGLEVDALNGEPGVRSARYSGEDASDWENNALLLSQLEGVADTKARFVCVIALAQGGKLVKTFRGEVQGEIRLSPRGAGGFGYDPLFFYPPLNKSFAELSEEEKFQVSHRGAAMRAMLAYLPFL